MIIKSIFKRYERWNPVHPTWGAFWGVGVGIGCGVGWGPGFGPEVIGYVGSGCGVGFSVGYTLFGLGIGLPTNHIFTVPRNAFMSARRGVLESARIRRLLSTSERDGSIDNGSHSDGAEQNICFPLISPMSKNPQLENGIHLPDVKSMLISRAQCIDGCLQQISGKVFPRERGSKNQEP